MGSSQFVLLLLLAFVARIRSGEPQSHSSDTDPPHVATEHCECDEVIQLRNDLKQMHARLTRVEGALNPRTCRDVLPRHENDEGGVYTIYPFAGGGRGVEVYCDLVTDGGGWLVFQRRVDGTENFNRKWDDYVHGFGSLDGEFWLGLELLHHLTHSGNYEMRIDMEDFEGNKTYAAYILFSVGVGSDYSVAWQGFYGSAGQGMTPPGTRFSTIDHDQDTYVHSCAQHFNGGWWFTDCHDGNLNGFYYGGPHHSYADGVNWRPFRGYHYSIKSTEMKIRKF